MSKIRLYELLKDRPEIQNLDDDRYQNIVGGMILSDNSSPDNGLISSQLLDIWPYPIPYPPPPPWPPIPR